MYEFNIALPRQARSFKLQRPYPVWDAYAPAVWGKIQLSVCSPSQNLAVEMLGEPFYKGLGCLHSCRCHGIHSDARSHGVTDRHFTNVGALGCWGPRLDYGLHHSRHVLHKAL